jgi:hypothetical protein
MVAAVTDPYATAATYRAVAAKDSAIEDSEIDRDLLAVSRYLTRKLDQFFTKDTSAVARLYQGSGTHRLYLTDHEQVPGLGSLTNLAVNVDLDGDYDVSDTALTINIHFWPGPQDADKGAEPRPWRYLDLKPNNAVTTIWPTRERAVQVTAIYGWPAVPKAIEIATCHLTALLRLETARSITSRSDIGEILGASREAQGIVSDLMISYRKVPTF